MDTKPHFGQMISRPPDSCGNGFMLLLVFNKFGACIRRLEARDYLPSWPKDLLGKFPLGLTLLIAPNEYNRIKKEIFSGVKLEEI